MSSGARGRKGKMLHEGHPGLGGCVRNRKEFAGPAEENPRKGCREGACAVWICPWKGTEERSVP